MSSTQPLVLVVGGTGRTGSSIVAGLLKHGKAVRYTLHRFRTGMLTIV
jgi:uncharacterized protein YbjT (DUF2867 family)